MGTGTALALQLLITTLEHASELNALILAANAQGRDVTPDEINGLRDKAQASIDRLQASIDAAP